MFSRIHKTTITAICIDDNAHIKYKDQKPTEITETQDSANAMSDDVHGIADADTEVRRNSDIFEKDNILCFISNHFLSLISKSDTYDDYIIFFELLQ